MRNTPEPPASLREALVARLIRLPAGRLVAWASSRPEALDLDAKLAEAPNNPSRQVQIAAAWLKWRQDHEVLLADLEVFSAPPPAPTPPPTPAPAPTPPPLPLTARLAELLQDAFEPHELRIFLLRLPWGERVVADLSTNSSRALAATEAAQKIVGRGHVAPDLFAALTEERLGKAREIQAIAEAFASQQRPVSPPVAPAVVGPPTEPAPTGPQPLTPPSDVAPAPQHRRTGWVVAALAAATLLGLLMYGHLPTPQPSATRSPPLPPAPRSSLDLALIYLDPPAVGAADPVSAMASALNDLLARSPRAVLVVPALAEGPDVQPILDVLARRASDGPPVLALLPDAEGAPLSPGARGFLQPYRSALPPCASGERGCVDLLLPAPFDAADPAWRPSEDGASHPRADRPLDRLARCDGASPFASLALALLARDGRGALADGGLPLERACLEGVTRGLRALPSDPCALPWSWAWVSELRGARATADPLGDPASAACPSRRALLEAGGLADRVVVLANPLDLGRPITTTLVLRDVDAAPTPRQLTQAEALVWTAYNTLGWLEER